MNTAAVTQLNILKLSDIIPNFSELARQYGMDWRTVKKVLRRIRREALLEVQAAEQ